ncbi:MULTISPECIES: alpha/beta hydrolase [unclassified Inquilinus]|uniref:alpha/beta hydrolase n=1 Tax=unclassified Inquilinus TaxID=2645927 RepID=UPI003F936739
MSEPLDPFMIRAHVPEFETHLAAYRRASEQARRTLRGVPDLAYGDHPDEKLDLYLPAEGEGSHPVHVFVHGGYWRAFSKADYAFVADAVTAQGAIAAIIDYSLMPKARMAVLVDQVRRAVAWVAANAGRWGGDPKAISASGASAGAHLASFLACHGAREDAAPAMPVRSLLLVSGIYDLGPITRSFLQPEIALTAAEVAAWSPLAATPMPGRAVDIVVGADETPPFLGQGRAFAAHLAAAGVDASFTTLPGENHMSIATALGTPGTALADRLGRTIAASRRGG